MAIIEIDNLTKTFKLGQLDSFTSSLLNHARKLVGKETETRPEFKALDDVSFKIDAGEVVGVIGHNGAGKSTLLKLLARITCPTSGTLIVRGRIAPLIEVGAGFVPELTGRENVYLNGAILGLSRKEINRKFDEIVDFAEMETFIDTPVKRYSSGMKVKLAFAVATSVESEILVVDEVLAVGDLAFQRKCFDRMEDTIKRQGRTVIMVSHNIRQVVRLCERVIMLDHGRLVEDGPATTVCEAFFKYSNDRIMVQAGERSRAGGNVKTSGEVVLSSVALHSDNARRINECELGDDVTISVHFESSVYLENIELIVGFHTTDFVYITSMSSILDGIDLTIFPGLNSFECKIRNLNLVPGVYAIRVAVMNQNRRRLFYGDSICLFSVTCDKHPTFSAANAPALGMIYTPASWFVSAGASTGLVE